MPHFAPMEEQQVGLWQMGCSLHGKLNHPVQEMDLVLEEDFLDLLVIMVREMPCEELWQISSTRSGASDAFEAGVAAATLLTVRASHTMREAVGKILMLLDCSVADCFCVRVWLAHNVRFCINALTPA